MNNNNNSNNNNILEVFHRSFDTETTAMMVMESGTWNLRSEFQFLLQGRRYTCAPVYLRAGIPARRYTCAPLYLRAVIPARRYTCAPLYLRAVIPARRFRLESVSKYILETSRVFIMFKVQSNFYPVSRQQNTITLHPFEMSILTVLVLFFSVVKLLELTVHTLSV